MPPSVKNSEIQTIDRLIESFETAMLTTESLSGQLRARPMMIADHLDGGALVFVTRAEDEKLEEVLHKNQVAVTMQSGGQYLSISGTARLETDRVKLDELWSPSWKIWFPGGRGDPECCLIRVEPTVAEYWDRTGANTLEFFWEAGKALLRGEKARDEALAGHGKVKLGKKG